MRDESGSGRPAHRQYIEPTYMIGDDETVAVKGMAIDPHARTHGARCKAEEATRPGGSCADRTPQQMGDKAK
jgi:hypothetical protein